MTRITLSSISSRRLPVTPLPCRGESLRGYLLRLSEENGYVSPTWLRELEPGIRRSDEPAVFEAIKRLTGFLSPEDLIQTPFTSIYYMSRYSTEHPRLCPECVKEKRFHDAAWEVAFACVCPYHGVVLIDHCPTCGATLSWKRRALRYCSCEADLTRGHREKATESQLYLNSKIWAALGRDVPAHENRNYPDEQLSRMSLEQLCQLLWFMASYGNAELRLNRSRPDTVAAAIAEMEVAGSVLTEWPAGFCRILNSRRNTSGCFEGEGLQQAFGKLYTDLYGQLDIQEFAFVREAFENFISSNWTGLVNRKYRRLPVENACNGSMTIKEAAKLLEMGERRLRKLVELGLVRGAKMQRPSGRRHVVIFASDVERFKTEIPFMINRAETRALLGISQQQFEMLLEAGKIKPLVKTGDNGLCQWWFDSRPIQNMLDGILASTERREPDVESVPFGKATQLHIGGARNFISFLEGIKSGSVAVSGIKKEKKLSLSSLFLLPESISKFRSSQRERQDGVYSVPEVAIKMGVKQEVAYHLVRRELLPSYINAEGRSAGRLVSEESIAAFDSEYLGLVHIARSHNQRPKVMKQHLDRQGIAPVIGPAEDGCRQIFYRRVDLPAGICTAPGILY